MPHYKMSDLKHLVPETITLSQEQGILAYVNYGAIPPADPCLSCEPNVVRKFIARIQAAEKRGEWPPKELVELPDKEEEPEAPAPKPRGKGK